MLTTFLTPLETFFHPGVKEAAFHPVRGRTVWRPLRVKFLSGS